MKSDNVQHTPSVDFSKAQALINQGQFGQAEMICQDALSADSEDIEALKKLSQVYRHTGRLEEALDLLVKANNIDSSDLETLSLMAATLRFAGRPAKAQNIYAQLIIAVPDDKEFKASFAQSLGGVGFRGFNPATKKAIELCFSEPNLRHKMFSYAWMSMIEFDPDMAALSSLLSVKDYEDFRAQLDISAILPLLTDSFVCEGLIKCNSARPDFETLWTHLRRYFMTEADISERTKALPFLCALSMTCFYNEYLYQVIHEEEEILSSFLDKTAFNASEFALLACYLPLHTLENVEAMIQDVRQFELDLVFQRQITEPREEEKIKGEIPSLLPIENEVSKAVQAQYEEHPYPRWTTVLLKDMDEARKKQSAGRDVLIAGCGTGQEAVLKSRPLSCANIDAIDLSRASLAHAIRKARELDISNINFMHGDILSLPRHNKDYDYIISSGVLHHMEDPVAGLKALLSRLKPRGVITVCLYSEIGRTLIVECQQWAKDQGFGSSTEDIKAFRKALLTLPEDHSFQAIARGGDFYSVSECRDLLFHAQEHRFTCLQLKEILDDLDLELLYMGSQMNGLYTAYQKMFPDDKYATNLENWHEFEKQNPAAFLAMYNMLLARKGDYSPGEVPAWLYGLGFFSY